MDAIRRQPEANQFSSSPAFGTPAHPILPAAQRPLAAPAFKPAVSAPILPILLPPPTLRPLAFRTFTKKHNLTLTGPALQALATFVGRHCGSGWREEGTGEKVLDEVAKLWKAESGPVIVEDNAKLKSVLKTLEGSISGGRVGAVKSGSKLSRESSFAFGGNENAREGDGRPTLEHHGSSFGMSALNVDEVEDDTEDAARDPRAWIKVISAYSQPRLSYDAEKKHFLPSSSKPSFFAPPAEKTAMARERYNIIHQRLLRNEAFQAPSFSARMPTLSRQNSTTTQQFYKITPIANLLGRGGSQHLLLGMLVIAPTGGLALNDPTGSISLDLQHAAPMQGLDSAYFCPGMIMLVEGQYEEDWAGAGSSGLGNTGGVGGTIGGRFLGFNISGPPVEKRNLSLGIDLKAGDLGGGFGWTDFLGLGSERAVGQRMRRIEQRLLSPAGESESRRKMVVLGEVTLDSPSTLSALRKVLSTYSSSPPMTFVLTGNFTSRAAMANAGTGSVEYKELIDALAAVLSDFPDLLRQCTWAFIPGDNDPWASSFSAGASTLVPRDQVPDLFTSRIRRVFASAKSELGQQAKKGEVEGEAIWTSNPARLSLFGPAHEVVVFRDDISGRMRRNAVRVGQATNTRTEPTGEDEAMSGALPTTEDPDAELPDAPLPNPPTSANGDFATAQAKKLILSLLPQSTLSPFPTTIRPVHWSYASSLSLYPLPHALVLVDAEAEPFALTFEGCHVLNPGRLVTGTGRRRAVRWAEYDCWTKRGVIREDWVS